MNILLISTGFNGMTQRVHRELALMDHTVSVELAISPQLMLDTVSSFAPDLIVCPFLTKRIPDSIWQNYPCLIVHPGIEGDRGASSIDWALTNHCTEWGVTLLQAAEEMDAGDIWATQNFPLRQTSKASTYRREVTATAAALVKQAVTQFENQMIKPRVLDYSNPNVKGYLNPTMTQSKREVDWELDSTDLILKKINAADSCPGVLTDILGIEVALFGARLATDLCTVPSAVAGSLIAQSHGAIAIATIDGAIWVRQLKLKAPIGERTMKLPATLVLADALIVQELDLPHYNHSNSQDACFDINNHSNEISIEIVNAVAYLHFDFYNGAMDTEQCHRLRHALNYVKLNEDVKVIALMGGEDFWSNGIHLKTIEHASNPADESWANINAINDIIKEIIETTDKLTVAALRTNAGAGGAMMALACDHVVIRDGVILNPHYQSMGLYGSEYWTYCLPRRIGIMMADKLTTECMPLLAAEALNLSFADELFEENWDQYDKNLRAYCEALAVSNDYIDNLLSKRTLREIDEIIKPLQQYRNEELAKMHACFYDNNSEYHQARYNFVYKIPVDEAPAYIAIHRSTAAKEKNTA
ncbi:hypothetical protein HQQ94_13890 [Shewanella sp. VB17]|uniref:enoyl-CoA hydratase-related protein n=1 Tax=Shewanella sp. VB17 TaxID=2739432 RepID=UPI001564151C|nr:enoyl-CoA hydratase-related protein [Shewanella sp. VB17]NRD74302.1 hypothetical protein [Shewanella sp. VB17]